MPFAELSQSDLLETENRRAWYATIPSVWMQLFDQFDAVEAFAQSAISRRSSSVAGAARSVPGVPQHELERLLILVEYARQLAQQPDNEFAALAVNGVDSAWTTRIVHRLRESYSTGTTATVLASTSLHGFLAYPMTSRPTGPTVIKLCLELVKGGDAIVRFDLKEGAVQIDPMWAWYFGLEEALHPSFSESLKLALRIACGDHTRTLPRECFVRWRFSPALLGWDHSFYFNGISGRSMGLAFALGIEHLLQLHHSPAKVRDSRGFGAFGATAELVPDGSIKAVEGLWDKFSEPAHELAERRLLGITLIAESQSGVPVDYEQNVPSRLYLQRVSSFKQARQFLDNWLSAARDTDLKTFLVDQETSNMLLRTRGRLPTLRNVLRSCKHKIDPNKDRPVSTAMDYNHFFQLSLIFRHGNNVIIYRRDNPDGKRQFIHTTNWSMLWAASLKIGRGTPAQLWLDNDDPSSQEMLAEFLGTAIVYKIDLTGLPLRFEPLGIVTRREIGDIRSRVPRVYSQFVFQVSCPSSIRLSDFHDRAYLPGAPLIRFATCGADLTESFGRLRKNDRRRSEHPSGTIKVNSMDIVALKALLRPDQAFLREGTSTTFRRTTSLLASGT